MSIRVDTAEAVSGHKRAAAGVEYVGQQRFTESAVFVPRAHPTLCAEARVKIQLGIWPTLATAPIAMKYVP
jgi:hypothetical protein